MRSKNTCAHPLQVPSPAVFHSRLFLVHAVSRCASRFFLVHAVSRRVHSLIGATLCAARLSSQSQPPRQPEPQHSSTRHRNACPAARLRQSPPSMAHTSAFTVEDTCTGCGRCARDGPVSAISQYRHAKRGRVFRLSPACLLGACCLYSGHGGKSMLLRAPRLNRRLAGN